LGVFITYFLFGMGISYVINQLNRMTWLRLGLYGLFCLLSAVLFVGHLRDALRYKRSGNASDMDLGLSGKTHHRIHDKIRQLTEHQSWLMAPAALVLGFVVSSMEFVCTGQVLLPVLTAINATHGVSFHALTLLFIYNVFFILPLLLITVLAISGVGGKAIASWARVHVFETKLGMAALFAALTLFMGWLFLRAL
jgi:hypothetical protein